MDLRSRPGYVEEDLRQFTWLGEHRPVAGVHLDQPPVPTGQGQGQPRGDQGRHEGAQHPLVDGVDGHDIDCKVDGFGAMQLKSSVVKKA